MQESNAVPRQLNGVTIDSIQVAPSFAASNMVVTVGGQSYLFTGDGAQNMIRALTMAKIMGISVNFSTTGYVDRNGYGYIDCVTIG